MPTYVDCNLCGQNRTRIIQKAEPPFQVVKCLNCGLVYTNPQPDINTVKAHYQEAYYREWIDSQMDRRIHMWKKRLNDIQKIKPAGKLLDVGCGIGTFLDLAKDYEYNVQGTEISEFGARHATQKSDLDVFLGDIAEANFPSDHFDIVTLWHSLEHVPNPTAHLQEINRILKADGLLVIAVPNVHNIFMRVIYLLGRRKKLKLFALDAKEWHFYFFSLQTLSALLNKTGFFPLRSEMDLAQIEPSKKMVDSLAKIVHTVTGKNYGEGLKVYASKI